MPSRAMFINNAFGSFFYFFKTDEYSGTLKSSDEGEVFWTKLETLKTMNLAVSFDKIIVVFCDDNIQEYIQLKGNDKWIDIFK